MYVNERIYEGFELVERPELSKNETEVARVLIEMGSGTTRQVFERIAETRTIDFATVQTYLRRLENKGYVRGSNQGRTRVYVPRVKLTTVIRQTVSDLIDRLFDGQTMPLVRHLIEDRKLSEEELQELRKMLK